MRSPAFAPFGLTAAVLAAFALAGAAQAKTYKIGIGHQSMCTDTYSAGIVVKEMKFFDKRLAELTKTPKYKDAAFEVRWADYSSGGPITNQMLANKLNIGVMGDYPLIVNGAKFQETKSLRTLYVAGTGYNLKGSGNAIVVPVKSDIYSLSDLKGKTVSTPFGSAAWGMLLKSLDDSGLTRDVQVKNQSPAVGAANIAAGKIDAHSDFCPWSELMEFRGTGRKIYDGSEAGVPYLHGVVVRQELAADTPEIVVAFLKAVVDAGKWINEDPMRATKLMEEWTGVEKEVLYLYFSKGGHLTLDPTIKPKWLEALKFDHKVLVDQKKSPALDFDAWITEDYIKKAYADLGMDYDGEKKLLHDPAVAHMTLPMEIWHARDGIKTFPDIAAFLKAYADYKKVGQKLNATYVYDKETGLKLFGKMAYYVKGKDGAFSAFLRKPDAEKYAKAEGGSLMDLESAVAGFSG
jgi:NitT/TauT family transport system substrate-binding protein